MRSIHIVVLNWNGLDDTARCLESLSRLSAPDDAAIVTWVVDNGSQDGSQESLPPRYPWARFLFLGSNLRYAGGNNRGIRAALDDGADFVLLLNNDTEADRDLLRALVEEADRSTSAGVFGPRILDADGRVWFAGAGVSKALGWTWHRGVRGPDPGPSGAPRDTDYVTGCCLLARRAVFQSVGGLDEGYYLYSEDVDFCLRARSAGYACRYVPKGLLVHYVSSSSGGAVNPFKAYQRTRAGIRLFSRASRGWRRFTWPPGFAALLAVQSAVWFLRGHGAAAAAAWRAVIDAWEGRPAADAFPVPSRSSARAAS